MTLKLFTVSIEDEIVVVAKDAEEAERYARRVARSDLDPTYTAAPLTYLPGYWSASDIPHGDPDDRTIGELIEAGAAPGLVSAKATPAGAK